MDDFEPNSQRFSAVAVEYDAFPVNETISQDQSEKKEDEQLYIRAAASNDVLNSDNDEEPESVYKPDGVEDNIKIYARHAVPKPESAKRSDEVNELFSENVEVEGENSFSEHKNTINSISRVLAKYTRYQDTREDTKPSEAILDKNNTHHSLVQFLITSLAKLTSENARLKNQLEERGAANDNTVDPVQISPTVPLERSVPDSAPSMTHQTVHGVLCLAGKDYFLDIPRMFKGDTQADHLRGLKCIINATKYLETNPHIAFLEVAKYHCMCEKGSESLLRQAGYKNGKMINDSPLAERSATFIQMGDLLINALTTIVNAHPDKFPGISKKEFVGTLSEPYIPFYHYNKTIKELAESSGLDEQDSVRVHLLCDWFEKNQRKDWDEAHELFSRGMVNAKHCSKLFRPGEIVVRRAKNEDDPVQAFKIKKFPWSDDDDKTADIFHWSFNGVFRKVCRGLTLSSMEEKGEKDIKALDIYPIRYAQEIRPKLLARGNKFWTYRKPCLVSFMDVQQDGTTSNLDTREQRHMIDYKILRSLYPGKPIFHDRTDDLGQEAMNQHEPPDDDFLTLLPPQIHAFDLATKTWKYLQVECLTDVTWNKESFEMLVIPSKTKELVQAAITAHGQQPSVEADLISDKGNGLLILLHGGPGTGKTLTAESIAEEQGRPLYRVTCGDIGVEPAEVERYLKTVLVIGKAWGCVVLLDEADVFLEERSSHDPKQNAIVSIFLRVLEYYDGILILTTNRVGTFDEAFKSRIHLTIRYLDLDEEQRLQIWKNMFHLLSRSKERIDIGDLNLNVHKLARECLNGRQIRNIITLARYLARFRKEMLTYRHVQDALGSVVEFDKYLQDVRGSDEVFARQARIR